MRNLRTRRSLRPTLAAVALAALAAPAARAAVMETGVTREQMTNFDSSMDGFFANTSNTIFGDPGPFHQTWTHLTGQWYIGGADEVTNGIYPSQLFLGRDYVNNPGPPIGIKQIYTSPNSPLAIIEAATTDNRPRNPNVRLLGVDVAHQNGNNNTVGTIFSYFAGPANLQFINDVTGLNITQQQILAGQSILAAPSVGMHFAAIGYGTWGNYGEPAHNPDGLPGWMEGEVSSQPPTFPDHTDPSLFFFSEFRNDLTYGPLNGLGLSYDSGSPTFIIVPEPGVAGAFGLGMLTLIRRRRDKPTPRCRSSSGGTG